MRKAITFMEFPYSRMCMVDLIDETEEIKWKILIYILDLFLTLQIPYDQIQSAGIERIFSSEYPLYTTNNSDMHSSFFNYYYPNGEYLSSLKFPQQVDFLYECNKKNYFYEWVRGTAKSTKDLISELSKITGAERNLSNYRRQLMQMTKDIQDLTINYRNLSDADKNSDIGKQPHQR